MSERVFNFNPGPATLPLPVLEEAQRDLLNYANTGMSVMEISHRSKEYEAINSGAEALFKELLGVPDNYRVLFLQGGASTQFAAVPLNLRPEGQCADYILTGSWAEKAYQEASKLGETHVAASTKEDNYNRIPKTEEIKPSAHPAYVHICSNNTIFGTQWQQFPDFEDVPLIADMSSDIFSRPFNASKFALVYAGSQKNLGPAGVTVVLIRSDLIEKSNPNIPTMLRYAIHAKNDSLYNTPPAFAVYMVNLVLKWIKENGGLSAMEARNQEKAGCIYQAIDTSNGFFKGHAAKDSRSMMNITFRLTNEELEKEFVAAATKQNLVGLKGHRSVGGIRASVYNAMPLEGCKTLAEFMVEFQKSHS